MATLADIWRIPQCPAGIFKEGPTRKGKSRPLTDKTDKLDSTGTITEDEVLDNPNFGVAYDASFTAIVGTPIKNSGRFYAKAGMTDEEAQESFLSFLAEAHGLFDIVLLEFNRVPDDQKDVSIETSEGQTVN